MGCIQIVCPMPFLNHISMTLMENVKVKEKVWRGICKNVEKDNSGAKRNLILDCALMWWWMLLMHVCLCIESTRRKSSFCSSAFQAACVIVDNTVKTTTIPRFKLKQKRNIGYQSQHWTKMIVTFVTLIYINIYIITININYYTFFIIYYFSINGALMVL